MALTLGLPAAVGPFAMDMYLYLPALPRIVDGLAATVSATESALTFYFPAFGAAQLVYRT